MKLVLEHLTTKYIKRKTIIGDDFSVNTSENDKQTRKLLDFMLDYNFNHYIKQPT